MRQTIVAAVIVAGISVLLMVFGIWQATSNGYLFGGP